MELEREILFICMLSKNIHSEQSVGVLERELYSMEFKPNPYDQES